MSVPSWVRTLSNPGGIPGAQVNGGVTFLGIDDAGKIVGCAQVAETHLNELRAVRSLCPDARLEFKRIPVTNYTGAADFIEVMRVNYREDKLVETSSGDAFVREGEQKRRLTEEEKREIRLNKGELDCESERVSLTFPDDFDIQLLSMYRNAYITKRGLTPRYNIQEVLQLSKLGRVGKNGFEPNLGCNLLFAKDPRAITPGAYIRVLRYDGAEEKFGRRLNAVSDRIFDGPLPFQIKNASDHVESQIRNFTRLGQDGRFATTPEYPKDVWLEAIVNAVVHRSYNLKSMNIFVKMFDDKLVVESPGAFLPPTRAETVFEAHNPRNPNTMWALYYFDFVRCAFEGTRRMRDLMRAANLPDPIFVQKTAGTFQVSVTLKNNEEHRKVYVRSEAAGGINPDLYAKLTESEKMIVNYLADHKRVNVNDAARIIALDWRRTKLVLEGLVTKNIVARSPGKTRSRHRFYFLNFKRVAT
jgi:ATP-dependent DNA helicase RecG